MLAENTVKALNDWGQDLVKFAKIKIGDRNRKRKSKTTGKLRRGAIESTGKLRNSFSFRLNEAPNSFTVTISAEDYAEDVSTGAPRRTNTVQIMRWIKDKPIRLRDANGKFVQMTESRKKNFAKFVANKVSTIGSDETGYLEEAIDEATKKHEDALEDGIFKDIEAAVNAAINGIRNN